MDELTFGRKKEKLRKKSVYMAGVGYADIW
jgi:hypothetical protein